MQNYTTTQGATNFTDAQSGFMDATGFLDLLSGLQFNTGGNLRSKLGYSDNSPFKSLGSIDIDGNVIDMSRTGKTLLATPDVGEPRELKPYSGTHVFPGATKVTETPIKAKGGKAKAQKWLNNYYQEGGPVSYTHLDVYKRQTSSSPSLNKSLRSTSLGISGISPSL